MKKSSFTAIMLGTVSGVLFALGMCMALIEDWNAMKQGIIMGISGIILGILTVIIWRRMEHKAPVKVSLRRVLIVVYTFFSLIVFGIGMCICFVAESIMIGSVIGILGIMLLLMLIPMVKGLK